MVFLVLFCDTNFLIVSNFRSLVGENSFYKKISPKFYEELEKDSGSESGQKSDSVVDIFRYPKIRLVSLMIFYVFFVISMVYMGISYNADHLPGNVWVINAVNGVLDGVSQESVRSYF